ncbi:MAG: hypothetical protein IT242_10290, partial [Bacteroidia bacterium]|nr:hypothetical protein [Bacteroidia bacterium]
MKTKIYTTFVFALICNGAFSQSVTITSSVCGSHDFTFSFLDGTGRNFLGGVFDALFWDAGTNEWQWTDYSTSPPVLLYTNSFASAPNPPCFNTGTWVQVNNLCGTITGITGDCQSSLTGIGDNEGSGRDFSVAFSQASGNIVLLLN